MEHDFFLSSPTLLTGVGRTESGGREERKKTLKGRRAIARFSPACQKCKVGKRKKEKRGGGITNLWTQCGTWTKKMFSHLSSVHFIPNKRMEERMREKEWTTGLPGLQSREKPNYSRISLT